MEMLDRKRRQDAGRQVLERAGMAEDEILLVLASPNGKKSIAAPQGAGVPRVQQPAVLAAQPAQGARAQVQQAAPAIHQNQNAREAQLPPRRLVPQVAPAV